ncbi:alkaline phosphatase isoform X2 [Folsomia candida]|uniref:alkaline phosphatase isoform X2 n=1 Tax=Folsomia candida TaxID=158441 RepID=UPI0016055EF2|nr:alkaline phosphatase isoform X2 [Folsomia candida]
MNSWTISVVLIFSLLGWDLCNGSAINRGEGGESVHLSDEEMHPRPQNSRKWTRQEDVEDAETWFRLGQEGLRKRIEEPRRESKAKNLIMFIGDGMSVSTVTASRIFKGQREGLLFGEEGQLHMDTFPYVGASKTYCSDWQVADSACSSTAYFTGTKGNAMTIGVKPSVVYRDCESQMNPDHQASSILLWAQNAGMSTGVVTTTTVTHASPSGAYAHIADRNWENDLKIAESGIDPEFCDDIAEQLVFKQPGLGINVILGGGRIHWLPNTTTDIEGMPGKRGDGKDLISTWLGQKWDERAVHVNGRAQLLATDLSQVDYLLGLFAPEGIEYADKQLEKDDPTLAEMTAAALQILSRNPNGFFLFVEGGRIDQAHHANNAYRAMAETLQFDEAIQLADNRTEDTDTLIVVSSDHSHLFTIAGDPLRGNDILDFSGNEDNEDGMPFTTLAYINGKGYRPAEPFNETTCSRKNISSDNPLDIDYLQVSQVPRGSATHAGEDVLIFAKGPFAHLFTGVNDQSYIPHAMAFAACISPFENNFCSSSNKNNK